MFDVKNFNIFKDIEVLGHKIILKFITKPYTETGNVKISIIIPS